MSDDLSDKLNGLSPKDKQQLVEFMDKLIQQKGASERPNESSKKKKNNPRRSRKKRQEHVSDYEKQRLLNVQKEQKVTRGIQKKRGQSTSSGIPCRTEQMDLQGNRNNRFNEFIFDTGEKQSLDKDKALDEKLSGKLIPTKRADLRMVEVPCKRCGIVCSVPQSLVQKEEGKWVCVCDECQRSRD